TASCFALLLLSVSILFPYTTLFRSVALFLLGAQSTFFGPIKYAYLPQAMHKDELVGANALFQTGTSLSILMGMIVAGVFTQLDRSEEHTSELQSRFDLVCRLLLEKK